MTHIGDEYDDLTMLQHLGEESHILGAVVPPIFQTSLFVFEDWDVFMRGPAGQVKNTYGYSRCSNPTVDLLQQKIAALEHADQARVFGSGMAAITTAIMSVVERGSDADIAGGLEVPENGQVILVDTIYGPSRRFITEYLSKFGVTYTIVEGTSTEELLAKVGGKTRLIYLESPSSIVFRLQDLRAITTECRKRGVTTMIDNTYGLTIQYPIDLGVDLVVHSASKLISGHSDVVAGVLCASNERIDKIHTSELELFGSIIAPLPAYLLTRGLRTLPLRLAHTRETANVLANYLAGRDEVETVMHVGLDSYPQAELRDQQMTGSGCIFSFLPKTNDRAKIKAFIESLRLFRLGVSWGGHESLVVGFPYHALGWEKQRFVIRLNCGFESSKDLLADLEQALPHLA